MRKCYGCFCRYISTCLISPNVLSSQAKGTFYLVLPLLQYPTQVLTQIGALRVLEGRERRVKQVIFVSMRKYFFIFRGLINNLPNTRMQRGKTEEGRAC